MTVYFQVAKNPGVQVKGTCHRCKFAGPDTYKTALAREKARGITQLVVICSTCYNDPSTRLQKDLDTLLTQGSRKTRQRRPKNEPRMEGLQQGQKAQIQDKSFPTQGVPQEKDRAQEEGNGHENEGAPANKQTAVTLHQPWAQFVGNTSGNQNRKV